MAARQGLEFIHGFDSGYNDTIKTDYFNYDHMTDGEFKLHLLAGKLRTLQQAHPNDQYFSMWRQGENYLLDAIYKGLHGTKNCSLPTGYIDPSLYKVVEAIKTAQNRFQPATKNGIFLIDRSSQSFGINPLDQLEPSKSGVNGYPFQDGCYTKYCNSNDNPCTSYTTTGSDSECLRLERMKDTLNQYLEKSAHHLLYNFATDAQALKVRPTQTWKVGQQILAVTEMAKICGVSNENMSSWVNLGITRQNAVRNLGALSPTDTITEMINNPNFKIEDLELIKNQYGINGIGIIPAVAYIIVACAIALTVVVGLIQALKGQEPTALDRVRGIGSLLFSPNGSDFPNPTGGGGTSCPTGSYWDATLNRCVPNSTGGGGGNCGTGFTWNAAQNRCVANTTYNYNSNTGLIIGGVLLAAVALNK